MKNDGTKTLLDLGERRIVSELLAARYEPLGHRFGHDCASLSDLPPGASVVATTDPCPPPMAHALGYVDEFYRGWLLAAINLSDLAAAGATPAGLLTSLMLPPDLRVRDFERLLDGVDACCAVVGATVVGGNIKEGTAIDVSATAVGYVEKVKPLSRAGAQVGDLVIAIGELGAFWAGVLTVRSGSRLEARAPAMRNVLTPQPKVNVARELHGRGLLHCAIDNSDGLQPSLAQLSAANGLRLVLDLDDWRFPSYVSSAATTLGLDPRRMALGWGDWQLIACCSRDDLAAIRTIAGAHDVGVGVLGEATSGSGVMARTGGQEGLLMRLESERFTADSWFSAGLDGYIGHMLEAPLLET